MELWIGALNLGLLYSFMTMGVFITFRIHDFPDITVDGSFTSGAAVTAILIVAGVNSFSALLAAFIIGALAGCATALIHTRLKINGLLAGILVMTGLYSINLHIMGRSNIPLLNQPTFFSFIERFNPDIQPEIWTMFVLLLLLAVFCLIVSFFFKTDFGISMRVTGNNPAMAAAAGINVDVMKIFGVGLANGLVAVSGGLVAQYQGFADIGMGIGTIVIGLAAVIIGESVLRKRTMFAIVLSVILGSVIFRFMIAIALYVGMNPLDLKLLTAVFVLATLIISKSVASGKGHRFDFFRRILGYSTARRAGMVAGGAVFVIAALFMYRYYGQKPAEKKGHYKIGIFQVSDHPLLNITRDSFIEEMTKLGYRDGENTDFIVEDANGDLPTVNMILDKFVNEDVDVVVPISTACTQAAINKIKDRPVVFATVANPFIIGAGTSEKEHLANVTGVYGWAPMDRMLAIVREVLPGAITVGAIWTPAQANSVFNVEQLQKAIAGYEDVKFAGATIASSSEVYEAAMSLVNKRIDAFVLPPDNIVYSAFESVVKAARTKKIPIFVSDVERLPDGALGALGYDYSASGIQAAHLVDRVLKGEDPKAIPFERYTKITLGFNLQVAKEMGITIPADLLAKATKVYGLSRSTGNKEPRVGIVQFATDPNADLCKKGVIDRLAQEGYIDGNNVEIIYKNAQADFSMISSIIQDFIRRGVDVIVPLSTPCLQAAVQLAGNRNDVKVVFAFVYDPYRVGVGKGPSDHLPNVTGVTCYPPVEKTLNTIKEMFPGRKKVGVVWNSSEANSESVLRQVRPYASKIGLQILEATVTNPSEVLDAARSLAANGAQIFLNHGDNTLGVSFDSFAKVAMENKIPVFSADSEHPDITFVTLGPDFYQTGYEGGAVLARVLNGEDPAHIPISHTEKIRFIINMALGRQLGFRVDESNLKRADKVIEAQSKPSLRPGKRPLKIALFHFNDHAVIMETIRGLMDELKADDFLQKNRITVDIKSGQNDFPMAQSIAQDIVSKRYDYIITLSTPALQLMAQTNKEIPHIFGAVTDPYRMGIAKTPSEHLPNVTGVATFQPVDAMIKAMRELFPKAKKIGIVWNPAEACSEACTLKAREASKKYHFELLEANVSQTGEVMDAVKSIISRGIDLYLLSGDNTVELAFSSIGALLQRYRIPAFTNNLADVDLGAFMAMGSDYLEVGRETARMAKRVIEGEAPKNIPIRDFAPQKFSINLKIAEDYGIPVPEEYIERAERIVR